MSEMRQRTQELHERAIGQLRRELAETHDAFAREREKAVAVERRADTAERHLSALREAVGPVLAAVRKVVEVAKDWGPAFKRIRVEMDLDAARAALAAHDAAPAAQRECHSPLICEYHGCDHQTAAPTLTLEEVRAMALEVELCAPWQHDRERAGYAAGWGEVIRRLELALNRVGQVTEPPASITLSDVRRELEREVPQASIGRILSRLAEVSVGRGRREG